MPCPNCHQEHDTTACPPPVMNITNYGVTPLLGWECPKCHAVMAPFQPSCIHCSPIVVSFSNTDAAPGD